MKSNVAAVRKQYRQYSDSRDSLSDAPPSRAAVAEW